MILIERWFWLDLYTAGYVIGSLELLACLCQCICLGTLAVFLGCLSRLIKEDSSDVEQGRLRETSWILRIGQLLFIITAILSMFGVACTGCLIYGIFTENYRFVLPFLIVSAIGLFLSAFNIAFNRDAPNYERRPQHKFFGLLIRFGKASEIANKGEVRIVFAQINKMATVFSFAA